MTQTFQSLPTYEQPLTQGKNTSSVWYRFWQALYQGRPPGAESVITPGTSPFTYQASQRGFIILQGGTVSLVQFSRGGVTNYTTGQTSGCFSLSAGDSLIVTYSATPNMTFVPQ
jgi:hypothetical protein